MAEGHAQYHQDTEIPRTRDAPPGNSWRREAAMAPVRVCGMGAPTERRSSAKCAAAGREAEEDTGLTSPHFISQVRNVRLIVDLQRTGIPVPNRAGQL